MKTPPYTILLVEDEPDILEAVEAYLVNAGYTVLSTGDGEEALALFRSQLPDMVILDLMLPRLSGLDVCVHIRKESKIPIVMLTAKAHEEDILQGFALGADDYVTKPFSPRELVARVVSLFRRCGTGVSPFFNQMRWNGGDLSIDFASYTVKKRGKQVNLTPSEFKLLATLAKYPEKTFTRDELIAAAFGGDFEGYDRTVDSHIKNLRAKIETDSSSPHYVLTIRGVGYRFGAKSGLVL